ncbi:RecBCD enzyme subunit RecC [Candidatus Erwinia haradaeae]|uniref:RecBCD enzyme subunit RecC n=1 Tax=Candidatus Erwinia haradaeae TaxID=1922217 RepID=A0A451DD74_9GAMM|nr:exodeoxyribonuclease V subunit gamma [Candidatus Erwinia haradaeae]VFP84387.1 RecBCD enzyme subunit RecC [Candidatus Erwinia haradaeae]
MIILYHSNQLWMLKKLLCREIKEKPLHNPLCPEVVLAPSSNIVQWLKISFAEEFGISANIDFPSSENFIWDMLNRVLPMCSRKSGFSRLSMRWKMRAIFSSLLLDERFFMLHHYLIDDKENHKLFQLTSCMASLFKEYLVHHPQWLYQWEHFQREATLGEAQMWQAPLWIALVAYTCQITGQEWGFADLFQKFISILKHSIICPPNLPERVFIFGLSTLPISYIEALGVHIDVHIFFENPCRYYWGNIKDHVSLTTIQHHHRYHYIDHHPMPQFRDAESVSSLFNTVGEQKLSNPLLSSWGQAEKENLFFVVQSAAKEVCAFIDMDPCNLLQILKRDILELEDHSLLGLKRNETMDSRGKRVISLDDCSIEIHLCCSLYHEVEVLQDQLLAMMVDDPALTVRDIMVMAADINLYVPFIEAIFSPVVSGRGLPFYISNNQLIQNNPSTKVFHILLRLPESQFTAEEVLALLEFPAVAQCFGINKEGLLLLRRWIPESGIRWGLDDQSMHDCDIVITTQNTWQFGLTRMLLGYAINSEAGEWNGILPFDESSGLIAALAGNLSEFIMCLKKWRNRLIEPLSLSNWLPICRHILDDFIKKNADNEQELAFIEDHWNRVINHGIQALYHDTVPLSRLRDELDLYFNEQSIRNPYLPGAINFCTLRPMACVPVKVVCLLGMNEGVYPRTILPLSVDLTHDKGVHTHTQKDNNSYWNSEKYTFLDALHKASKKFYISYVNKSIHDNTVCYPSLLVSELMEYISYSFVLSQDIEKDIASSSVALTKHLQHVHHRIPIAHQNFFDWGQSCGVCSPWLLVSQTKDPLYHNLSRIALQEATTKLSIDTLINFWRHPVRRFFQLRLNTTFERDTITVSDTEPFVVDNITRYQVDSQLLQALMNQKDEWLLYNRFKAAGILPYGAWGKVFWEERVTEMSHLAAKIAPHYAPLPNREILLNINNSLLLTGYLMPVQDHGLLRWRPGVLNFKDALILWLEHLVYCATGGSGVSLMLGLKDSLWRFLPLSADVATKYLLHYINGYLLGISAPLLLTSSGGAWLQACFDKDRCMIKYDENTQNQARRKLLQYWYGTDYIGGEKDDIFLQRLLPHLNATNIKDMMLAAENWLTPILQHHQIDSC